MKLNRIVFDVESLKHALLESDALTTLECVSEGVLNALCDLLFDGVRCTSLEATPASYFDTTGLAGDDAVICRIVWQHKHVAAALLAFERYRNLSSVHESLSFSVGTETLEQESV